MKGSTTQWTIDPSHTTVEFAVRHLGVSTVRGRFRKVSGTVGITDDNSLRAIDIEIDAASLDTAEPQRDAHLRSPDFLDTESHPTVNFRSTAIESLGDGRYRVKGDLTIRGQSHPVTFETETTRPITDPWGNVRAGASADGKFSRKDWGLTWNQVLEFGGLVVGDEVRFTLDVEAIAPAVAKVA